MRRRETIRSVGHQFSDNFCSLLVLKSYLIPKNLWFIAFYIQCYRKKVIIISTIFLVFIEHFFLMPFLLLSLLSVKVFADSWRRHCLVVDFWYVENQLQVSSAVIVSDEDNNRRRRTAVLRRPVGQHWPMRWSRLQRLSPNQYKYNSKGNT